MSQIFNEEFNVYEKSNITLYTNPFIKKNEFLEINSKEKEIHKSPNLDINKETYNLFSEEFLQKTHLNILIHSPLKFQNYPQK